MNLWSRYAKSYDLMADHNPAYGEMMREIQTLLDDVREAKPRRILDLGGGTGRLAELLAVRFPEATVHLVEPDPGMRRVAVQRFAAAGIENVEVRGHFVEEIDADERFDLICTVHALYTFPDPQDAIRRLHGHLETGGTLLACDVGRRLELDDWTRYLLSNLVRERGAVAAATVFLRGLPVAWANRVIAWRQSSGAYWTHDHREFRTALEWAGFDVVASKVVYRGYSDLCMARA